METCNQLKDSGLKKIHYISVNCEIKQQTYTHPYRHTEIQTYRHTDIQINWHTDILTNRHTDTQTCRQTNSHIDEHVGRGICIYSGRCLMWSLGDRDKLIPITDW